MAKHFGLDIGSDSIKIVQLEGKEGAFRVVTAGMIKTPSPGLVSEAEKDFMAVAEAIKRLKNEIKVTSNSVVVALPERSVFNQIIEVPKMNNDELAQAIPWEAENLIPQPIAEVNLDWQIIDDEESRRRNKMRVLIVAAPKTLIDKYLRVLKMADLEPVALETELLASLRCLRPVSIQGNLLLVNIGAKSLDVAIIGKGNMYLTRRFPTAGEAITRALGASLNLDLTTAEEYKKAYGLTNQLEGKIANSIVPIIEVVSNEIKKALHFYQEKQKEPLRLMVLSGGSSLLPGLTEYFTKGLGLEVQVADPFSLVKTDNTSMQALRKISPMFTVAIGLAMKD